MARLRVVERHLNRVLAVGVPLALNFSAARSLRAPTSSRTARIHGGNLTSLSPLRRGIAKMPRASPGVALLCSKAVVLGSVLFAEARCYVVAYRGARYESSINPELGGLVRTHARTGQHSTCRQESCPLTDGVERWVSRRQSLNR